MVKKEICDECEEEIAVVRCTKCKASLCDDCSSNGHHCLVEAVEKLRESMFKPIECNPKLEDTI